jgi:AraC-like DNA-binding protein
MFNKHLEFNSFTHKQWSILFSVKDNQILSINYENFKKNNVVIIPPYTHISSIFLGSISQPCRIAINDEYIKKETKGKFDFKNQKIRMIYIDNINYLREKMTSIFKIVTNNKNSNNHKNTKILVKNSAQEIVKNAVSILEYSQNKSSKISNQDLFHATNFIRYLRNEEFNIKKITKQTGIKDRTLRYKFLNSLNVSPKKFHMSLRLHEVMKALKKGDKKTIISDIANIWGFWHMGQFAKDYKQYYGELPSET